jgi:hypothetical protein
MELVLAHLKDHAVIYIIAAGVGLPILIIFKRHTTPIVFFLVEFSVYVTVMHGLMHTFVKFCAWFSDQASSKRAYAAVGEHFTPNWETPLTQFWTRELYKPYWLAYVELGFVAAILLLMYKYRPLRPQKAKKRPPPPPKKPYSATTKR